MSAEFQADALDRASGLLVKQAPHLSAAGERQLADPAVVHKRLSQCRSVVSG